MLGQELQKINMPTISAEGVNALDLSLDNI